jgi:N-acyl-L-homoserine lactone synthetase
MLNMDRLAPRFIAQAAPLRLGIAQSQAERQAVYRLRCHVVVTKGWADAGDFPNQMETDDYDARAITVVARDGERLVASVRVVPPKVGELLPTEQSFNMQINPFGEVVDIGRLVLSRASDVFSQRVLLGLLGQVWLVMRAHGFSQACGIMTCPMVRWYRSNGLGVTILGPARHYWGEDRYPALVPTESFELMSRKWEAVFARDSPLEHTECAAPHGEIIQAEAQKGYGG